MTTFYRHWLGIGLWINGLLFCFVGNYHTLFGPIWVWLVAIPLACLIWVGQWLRTSEPMARLPQAVRRARY